MRATFLVGGLVALVLLASPAMAEEQSKAPAAAYKAAQKEIKLLTKELEKLQAKLVKAREATPARPDDLRALHEALRERQGRMAAARRRLAHSLAQRDQRPEPRRATARDAARGAGRRAAPADAPAPVKWQSALRKLHQQNRVLAARVTKLEAQVRRLGVALRSHPAASKPADARPSQGRTDRAPQHAATRTPQHTARGPQHAARGPQSAPRRPQARRVHAQGGRVATPHAGKDAIHPAMARLARIEKLLATLVHELKAAHGQGQRGDRAARTGKAHRGQRAKARGNWMRRARPHRALGAQRANWERPRAGRMLRSPQARLGQEHAARSTRAPWTRWMRSHGPAEHGRAPGRQAARGPGARGHACPSCGSRGER